MYLAGTSISSFVAMAQARKARVPDARSVRDTGAKALLESEKEFAAAMSNGMPPTLALFRRAG
jgi:hypothetical protein